MVVSAWISALRLRTLPLALSSILLGALLAAKHHTYQISITVLCVTTTIFLQVLSNLANDYGDSVHGADSEVRQGPSRAVQTGAISKSAMKRAMILFVVLSLASGLSLLFVTFGLENWKEIGLFFLLGLLSIAAAIKYTAGKNPYGYAGLGDISVFVFFGVVGVMGTYYLHTRHIDPWLVLPAASSGLFAVGVLNINNIRDIDSDKKAGKRSIPVRIGKKKARIYHWLLLVGGLACALGYMLHGFVSPVQLLFLLSAVPFTFIGVSVWKIYDPMRLDPFLKLMALSTLLFSVCFGLGDLMAHL